MTFSWVGAADLKAIKCIKMDSLKMEINCSIFLTGVVIGLLLVLFFRNRTRQFSVLKRNGIPGPNPSLVWGNWDGYVSTPNVIWDSNLSKTYGGITGYYFGAKPVILVTDPDLVDRIQRKDAKQFLDRPRRVPGGINPDPKRAQMLGNLNVDNWKYVRQVLDKGFSPKNSDRMIPDIKNLIAIFMNCVSNTTPPINFYTLYQNLTLDLIGKTGFGVNSDIQQNPNDGLKAAVEQEFSKPTGTCLLKIYLCFPEFRPFLQAFRIGFEKVKNWLGKGARSELWDLGGKTVRDRLQNQSRQRLDCSTEENYSDLLTIMIRSAKLSADSIVANSVLFFEAGFETLSSSLAFITYLLIKNPESQRRVREEIKRVLENSGGILAKDLMKDFVYLDSVIKEALRMYPPQTTFIGRSGTADLHHSYKDKGGFHRCIIPKGVHVQIGLYQLLNDEDIWESPRTFRPERFLKNDNHQNEEENALRKKQEIVYQPFGQGRRICIGRRYADMVLKMVLIELFSNYELEPEQDKMNTMEENGDIAVLYKTATMTPKNGVYAKVRSNPLF